MLLYTDVRLKDDPSISEFVAATREKYKAHRVAQGSSSTEEVSERRPSRARIKWPQASTPTTSNLTYSTSPFQDKRLTATTALTPATRPNSTASSPRRPPTRRTRRRTRRPARRTRTRSTGTIPRWSSAGRPSAREARRLWAGACTSRRRRPASGDTGWSTTTPSATSTSRRPSGHSRRAESTRPRAGR